MLRLFLAAALIPLLGQGAYSQGLRAVQALPGYTCMTLANPPPATLDPTKGTPVRDAPSQTAPIASWSPSIVLVSVPLQATSGFLQAVFADKHTGWIAAADLRPWSSPNNPNRRCIPSVMSDGGLGFDFR